MWQIVCLATAGAFMMVTWAFGGEVGHKTALSSTLPWVIATNGVLAGLFMLPIKENQRKLDLAILCAVLSLFDFGLLPLSWYTIPLPAGSISVSGLLVAASLFVYVVYFALLFPKPSESGTTGKVADKTTALLWDLIHPSFLLAD